MTETYDRVSYIAGIPDENRNALLPPNHMTAKTDLCVTLDGDGIFRRAEASPLTIVIPCTENSASRTNSPAPHPLHDQLAYLALDDRKHDLYLAQLATWSPLHAKVAAVHKYIKGGTLLDDLQGAHIQINIEEYDERGEKKDEEGLKKERDRVNRLFVRFSVEIPGDLKQNLWEDADIAKEWQRHCSVSQSNNATLCYATGTIAFPAIKHPKGINPTTNGAKLISCNDETNYTYKGRFNKAEQANAISADASHKAHAMLKYLIATQGYKCDTQAIIAWNIEDGASLPNPFASSDEYGIYDDEDVKKTENDKLIQARGQLGTDFAKKLRAALYGMGNIRDLDNSACRAAIIAVDAATTGRMGITFYQDLTQNEYVDRLINWHETCSWWFRKDRREFIAAPSSDRIIAVVYGEQQGEGYNKIKKQALERLLHHIVCGEPLNHSWISAAVARVSNPFSYTRQDGGWDKGKWENAFNVACAISRKYYGQKGRRIDLELEKTCTDRSYLFGRLLAIADRIENHARYLQTGKGDTDKRPTNAVRYMTAFASKPLRTWRLIFNQLNPYIQRLNGAEWYQGQIDEIMSLFNPEAYNDKPLDGKYLLGYSLQRRALYTTSEGSRNENDEEEVSDEHNQEN